MSKAPLSSRLLVCTDQIQFGSYFLSKNKALTSVAVERIRPVSSSMEMTSQRLGVKRRTWGLEGNQQGKEKYIIVWTWFHRPKILLSFPSSKNSVRQVWDQV